MRSPVACRIVLAACTTGVLACGPDAREPERRRAAGTPSRLELDRDTLVINGPSAVRVPVRLVDIEGADVPIETWDLRLAGDSVVRIRDGRIVCEGRGDATIVVTVASLERTVVVRCRPVIAFGFPPPLELALRGPALPVRVHALGPAQQREELLAFQLRTSDSSIVEIRDGLVHPLSVGRANIVVDLGGIATAVTASVFEPIADDTLNLAPGEFRSWPLAAGRYEIAVLPLRDAAGLKLLAMETEGAKCVRDSQSDALIHCNIRLAGGLGVRNQATIASGHVVRALIRVRRVE